VITTNGTYPWSLVIQISKRVQTQIMLMALWSILTIKVGIHNEHTTALDYTGVEKTK
jgi:hypothetical protein